MDKKSVFSDRITNLRKEKGLTQAEVAEGIGVSRQSITLYESGYRLPDVEVLSNIARFFEVSSDYLIGLSDITINTGGKEIEKTLGLSSQAIETLIYLSNQKNKVNSISSQTVYEQVKLCFDSSTTLCFINYFLEHNPPFVNCIGEYINRRYTDIVSLASCEGKYIKDMIKIVNERNYNTHKFKTYLEHLFSGCIQHCTNVCVDVLPVDIYDNLPDDYEMSDIKMIYAGGMRYNYISETDETDENWS